MPQGIQSGGSWVLVLRALTSLVMLAQKYKRQEEKILDTNRSRAPGALSTKNTQLWRSPG